MSWQYFFTRKPNKGNEKEKEMTSLGRENESLKEKLIAL